jgi:transmembrane sensor
MDDKYLTYSSTTLAGEESFGLLVRHGENESQWNEWLKANPGFRPTFEEAKRVVIALDHLPQAKISATDKTQLWKDISANIHASGKEAPKAKIKGIWSWALTAAASLALLFWFGSEAGKSKVYAEAGEHKEVVLPEESIVSLNAGSQLTYKPKSFEKDRVLYLDGEAFFNVEPGSTFKVITSEGTVTVVGTSFNVVARNGRFEVSCYTGKVSVEKSPEDKALLTTGHRAISNAENASLEESIFNADAGKPEWTTGKFRFNNKPLTEVFSELERQYDVQVVLADGLGEVSYTGLFESGDLEEALKLITWPLQLESSIKGKTITITR